MGWMEKAQALAARIGRELDYYRRVLAHPRTPRVSRILLAIAVAYAVSPIDLIPDFIPVLGHLDDAVILPLLIWLAFRWVPAEVKAECRSLAQPAAEPLPPEGQAEGPEPSRTAPQARPRP